MDQDSAQLFVNEGGQLRFAESAHFRCSQLAVFEEHEGGDATNAKFGGDFSVFIDIHLGNLKFAFVASCHFIQDGSDHFAWTTPLGPIVHQDGLAGMEDIGLKGRIGGVLDEFVGHFDLST